MLSSLALSITIIFFNGNIFTSDPSLPRAEAIAVKDGLIVAIGSNSQILKLKSRDTRMVDLKGGFVTPGIIDAHLHFLSGSLNLVRLDLSGLSLEECLKKVKERAKRLKPGEWIIGRGWDQSIWKEKKYPNRSLLDKVAPENPVYLKRVDGHTAWVNSLALRIAGIDKNTSDPEGGKIERDKDGNPTGILKEEAASLVKPPEPSPEEKIYALKKGFEYAIRNGVTTVADMSGYDIVFTYRELELKVQLPLRIVFNPYMEYGLKRISELRKRIREWKSDFIYFGFVKGFIDGTLGSRTAAMKEPFKGTKSRGILVIKPDELFDNVLMYHRSGFQIALHVIGDRAVYLGLEAYRRAQLMYPRPNARHRLEHIQVYDPEDLSLFAVYHIIPSVQPCHLLTDIRFVEDRIGKQRAKHSYPWKSFLNLHLPLAFGTDWPVEPIDPRRNLFAAVKRLDWNVSERISIEDAIKASTINAAYSLGQEKKIGSLEVGKFADFVVWERDFTKIKPEEYLKNKVLMTVVGGKIIYKR